MPWIIHRSDELYHHGILGQKWGDRNGPPYPLDRKDYSAKEKVLNVLAKFNPRRYVSKDGSLTEEGRWKYFDENGNFTDAALQDYSGKLYKISIKTLKNDKIFMQGIDNLSENKTVKDLYNRAYVLKEEAKAIDQKANESASKLGDAWWEPRTSKTKGEYLSDDYERDSSNNLKEQNQNMRDRKKALATYVESGLKRRGETNLSDKSDLKSGAYAAVNSKLCDIYFNNTLDERHDKLWNF